MPKNLKVVDRENRSIRNYIPVIFSVIYTELYTNYIPVSNSIQTTIKIKGRQTDDLVLRLVANA